MAQTPARTGCSFTTGKISLAWHRFQPRLVGIANGGQQTDHVQHEGVGIAVWHHSGERTTTGHAKTTGVVDEDQVGSTLLDTFGGETSAWGRKEYPSAKDGKMGASLPPTSPSTHDDLVIFDQAPERFPHFTAGCRSRHACDQLLWKGCSVGRRGRELYMYPPCRLTSIDDRIPPTISGPSPVESRLWGPAGGDEDIHAKDVDKVVSLPSLSYPSITSSDAFTSPFSFYRLLLVVVSSCYASLAASPQKPCPGVAM